VLLVDDSAPLRARLVTLLSSLPQLEVVGEAKDGAEAIEVLPRTAPTLIVLDLRMPRLNGFEVLRHVRQHYPACTVIVLSALADEDCRQKCLELGAQAAFDKVTQFDQFFHALEAI
jgi:DNA-binding NarL/FixJ family response regulator